MSGEEFKASSSLRSRLLLMYRNRTQIKKMASPRTMKQMIRAFPMTSLFWISDLKRFADFSSAVAT